MFRKFKVKNVSYVSALAPIEEVISNKMSRDCKGKNFEPCTFYVISVLIALLSKKDY